MTKEFRWLPHPQLSLLLWVLWLLLVESVRPAHILLGAFLGWVIPYFTQHFWPEREKIQNGRLLVRYLLRLLTDILTSNFIVAKRILHGPRYIRPGFIYLPLDLDDDFAITVLASTISLTPGTVSANVSPDRKTLLIHALHVDDEAVMIADIKQRYEAPLKEIFGCSTP